MTSLDLDQLVIKRKSSFDDYVVIGNGPQHFNELLDRYLRGECDAFFLRVDMSSKVEKKNRQQHFDTIGIPSWMWGVLLGYILFIRDEVNVQNLPDLLVHSGIFIYRYICIYFINLWVFIFHILFSIELMFLFSLSLCLYSVETGNVIPPESYLTSVKHLFKCVGVSNTENLTFTVVRSSYATNQYMEHKKKVEKNETTQTKEEFLDLLAAVMNTSTETLEKYYILVSADEELEKLVQFERILDDDDQVM
jgi:hypothetical protein